MLNAVWAATWQVDTLYCGEVGYLAAQIKSVKDARVGDTVTQKSAPATEPLAGYEDVQPMVYCGLFPSNSDDYQVREMAARRIWCARHVENERTLDCHFLTVCPFVPSCSGSPRSPREAAAERCCT
jgi:translation elongation factor EF-4